MSRTGYSEGLRSVAWVDVPDGVRLYVEEYGDLDASLTVVLLHGWTLDARLWRHQLADLRQRYAEPLRIITFDLRGHGRSTSGSRDTTTLARLADDLSAVLRACVPTGRVVLVGHSMGGMTIMEYAYLHPDDFAQRVHGVVLVATSAEGSMHTTYGLGPGVARLVRAVEIGGAALLARGGPWRPHRTMMPALSPGLRWFSFGVDPDPAAVRLTADMIGHTRLTAIGGFRSWVSTHHRVEALAAMRGLPAAVLVGTHDRLTPVACFNTIVAALPDADQVICPEAGHILPLERPDEVTDAITRICHQAAGAPARPGVRNRIGALARDLVPKARRLRTRPRSTGTKRAA